MLQHLDAILPSLFSNHHDHISSSLFSKTTTSRRFESSLQALNFFFLLRLPIKCPKIQIQILILILIDPRPLSTKISYTLTKHFKIFYVFRRIRVGNSLFTKINEIYDFYDIQPITTANDKKKYFFLEKINKCQVNKKNSVSKKIQNFFKISLVQK